jgi:hypothetical protein
MLNTITQTVFHHRLNSNTVAPTVFYRTLNVEGLKIFYREAGPEMLPPFCSYTAFRRLLICSAI